jgi:hypothetical protein
MSWLISRALMEDYANSHSFPGLVAEYSAVTCSDGEQSALLSSTPTAQAFLPSDRMTAFSRLSRFGMTFAHLKDGLGEDLLTWFLADSRARTSAPPERAQESTASAPAYGAKWCALPVRFDRASSGWKTAHSLWDEDLPECSVTLPAWGCMHGGELWERTMWERPTSGSACGWLPTPTKTDANGRTYHYSRGDKSKAVPSLLGVVKLLPTSAATDWKGQYTWETVKKRMAMARGVRLPEELSRRVGKAITPNPEFWEWMMDWPIGSTALQPLAMAKFLSWRQQRGGF